MNEPPPQKYRHSRILSPPSRGWYWLGRSYAMSFASLLLWTLDQSHFRVRSEDVKICDSLDDLWQDMSKGDTEKYLSPHSYWPAVMALVSIYSRLRKRSRVFAQPCFRELHIHLLSLAPTFGPKATCTWCSVHWWRDVDLSLLTLLEDCRGIPIKQKK